MATTKNAGLANIARSSRKTRANQTASAKKTKSRATGSESPPPIQFSGEITRTSVALDSGVWEAVQDWTHLLTKRVRKGGKGRVVPKYLLTAALLSFHEKPIDEQLELVRQILP